MQLLAGQWDLDLESGRLTLCPRSRAMFGMSGDPSAALSEQDWVRALHPDDRAAVHQKFEAAVRYGEQYSERYRIVHPDGSIHPILSVGKPVAEGGGAARRFVGFNVHLGPATGMASTSAASYAVGRIGRKHARPLAATAPELVPSNENGPLPLVLTAQDIEDARRLLALLSAEGERRGRSVQETHLVRARAALAIRRSRENFFNRAMLAGPAFDLLLSLYAVEGSEIPTVRRLAELAGVPGTTALRWIQYLADKGFLSRTRGGNDRRTSVARLTEKGRATLDMFFATFTDHGLDAVK
jgi:DNA-binding MarR family transcriptional regulator